ncbi:MAG: tryptophan-rich sensory protein [Paracoccaceae bacterium]|nr:tryptophan-rich sensory protein [Paracoccaceae bacterium]
MTRHLLSLLVFLTIVMGGGIAIGIATAPGEWYGGLIKPAFNPPNWIFGPVWTILYVFIAIAGWRSWQRDRNGRAMKVWYGQMFLNFLWSPLFFAAQRIDLAFGVILLLLGSITVFVALTWDQDRPSAILFLAYAAWVAFASALNGSLLFLNGVNG